MSFLTRLLNSWGLLNSLFTTNTIIAYFSLTLLVWLYTVILVLVWGIRANHFRNCSQQLHFLNPYVTAQINALLSKSQKHLNSYHSLPRQLLDAQYFSISFQLLQSCKQNLQNLAFRWLSKALISTGKCIKSICSLPLRPSWSRRKWSLR